MTLFRSTNIRLSDFPESSSMEYSDSVTDLESCLAHDTVNAPIEHFCQMFKLQNLKNSKLTSYQDLMDKDFNLNELNTPIFLKNFPAPQKVDCVYLMCSQSNLFPQADSDFYNRNSMLYMWRNMSNILPSDFSAYVQDYFHDHYNKLKKPMRMFFQIAPTQEKLSNVSSIRNDVQSGRILFHYIGFGFPRISSNIKAMDKKTNTFVDYPLRNLFESLKPPIWFIFDCSHAAAVLPTLEETAAIHYSQLSEKQPWNDYFCFCATGENESLPSDPHLPHDFLTSALLTPTKLAVLCHILQYYRTTLLPGKSMPREVEWTLLDDSSDLHFSLRRTLDAITDAIAADILPNDQYKMLFRADNLTSTLFRNFLLAQYLLHAFQIHPLSHPHLPDLSGHPLWQHWRTTLDITIVSTLDKNHRTDPTADIDLFNRATSSFKCLLENTPLSEVPVSVMMILFHIDKNKELLALGLNLLAKYASISQHNREMITKVGHFQFIFNALYIFDPVDDGETFQSICYLMIIFFDINPCFITEIPFASDFHILEAALFNEKVNTEIKPMVVAILASLIPFNDNVRQICTRMEFLIKVRTLLETSNSDLSMWLLLLERRLFDNYGVDLVDFYNLGMHIQAASFCYHNSEYVRAAALALLPCLLQADQDYVNIHLFGLSMMCGFDCSFLVRFNFALFLTRFLNIYNDNIVNHVPIGLMAHQLFGSVVANWLDIDGDHENVSLDTFSDFMTVSRSVALQMRKQDYITRFICAALFLTDQLADDPHPSVSQVSIDLKKRSTKVAGIKPKLDMINMEAGKSVPLASEFLRTESSSPPRFCALVTNDDGIRGATTESGGDALYKVFMRLTARRGLKAEQQIDGPFGLPPAPVEANPSIKVVAKSRCEFSRQPTVIAYDKLTLVLVAGFEKGKVIVVGEDGKITENNFGDGKVTSIAFSNDLFNKNHLALAFIGTDDGCIYGWDMTSKYPQFCFRSDGFPLAHIPQFVECCGRNVVTARGNYGSVRVFDPYTKKLSGEWNTLSNAENRHVTAMSVVGKSGNVAVGFSHGRIIVLNVSPDSPTRILDLTADPQQKCVFKIASVLSPSKDSPEIFLVCQEDGTVLSGPFLACLTEVYSTENNDVVSFDGHRFSPVMCISTKESCPKLLNRDGEVISVFRDAGVGCIVAFHQTLPLVCVATQSGKILEYSFT